MTLMSSTKHTAPDGKVYTQEYHLNGPCAWEIVKDETGQIVPTIGSGGWRPWEGSE